METICGSLLQELQQIWDEVGESDEDRDAMLLQIEQECLKVYKGKVDEAKRYKVQLQQAIARYRAEIADIYSVLGEPSPSLHFDEKSGGGLKRELEMLIPLLEDTRKRKLERKNQFLELVNQMLVILKEISSSTENNLWDETDLSLKRLEELKVQLQKLQNEKRNRLELVKEHLGSINSLCAVLGMDYKHTISNIRPNLDDPEGPKDLSDDMIKSLYSSVQNLQAVKMQRWKKLQDLAVSLMELWTLLEVPSEEQEIFRKLTCNIAASESELTEPNMLSSDFINSVEAEVLRLGQLKSSKLKEIVLKKKTELEEICQQSHLVTKEVRNVEISVEAMESGSVDAADLLEQIDLQISKAKEEASKRKEILKKVEKWMVACEEECWLEEYNRDDNHYYAGRGAHLTLKRAEKARAVVNKIPAMVESLISITVAWEKERGIEFLYDGVRLLSMLEQYNTLRQEKEQERQRQREQKKLHDRMIAEKEALFGSKASLLNSGKKSTKSSQGALSNKKLSLGGALIRNPKLSSTSTPSYSAKKVHSTNQNSPRFYQQNGESATKRNSEVPGYSVKKHSSSTVTANATETPLIRKPLSPLTSTVSSNVNIANSVERQNRLQSATSGKTCSKALLGTPSRYNSASNQEGMKTPKTMAAVLENGGNLTPKTMPIPVPTTPPTASVAMVTAMTPATPRVPSGGCNVEKIAEKVEYSFEEERAGFDLPERIRNLLG